MQRRVGTSLYGWLAGDRNSPRPLQPSHRAQSRTPEERLRQARRAFLYLLIAVAAACSDDDGTGPVGPGQEEPAVGLTIVPGAVLLSATGTSAPLRAAIIQEDGDTVEVTQGVVWQSSNQSIVTVSGSGVVTAQAFGAATVTAQASGFTSAPALALVASPAAGAMLVSDAQVAGPIEVVDPAAPYVPGWRYRVPMRGLNPAVGQVVLASEAAPVGGRVVSVGASVDGVRDVVLELLPLASMFQNLSMDVQLPLKNAVIATPAAPATHMGFRPAVSGYSRNEGARTAEVEFSLGRFECKAEVPPAFQFPVTLDAFDVDIDPQLTFDLVIEQSSIRRLMANGSIEARITANPLVTAALEAKAECLYTIRVIILPIGGPIALIVGGQIPVGVGFEIGAKASFGQLGFDAFYEASMSGVFGIDCTPACEVVADMNATPPEGFFKPRIPSFQDDLRFELTASAFAFAKLTIGNPFLRELQFETVELKGGVEQKFDLAGMTAQANDPAYASSFALKPVIEFKTSSKLQAVAGLLGITLAELTFSPELPTISQSPRGTFSITPTSVVPGDETALGDAAQFRVTLDPVSYFGAYAVERVEIRWLRSDGTTVTLEPGRPGCTDLPATSGQVSFTCQTDFREEDVGEQTFFAFVHPRIFGVPLPVTLEVGTATVLVSGFSVTTASLPPGLKGISYSQTLAAENGSAPFTWSVAAGNLPSGLSLSEAGVISGTPTTRGDFSFTVSATDADSAVAARDLTLAVHGMDGTWTGTFNGTFTSFDGSVVRESPGEIVLVLTQNGTAVTGTASLVTVFGPATGTASGTFTGTGISGLRLRATSQTVPPCSGTFTGTATVDVVAGTMTANYSGSDCAGTVTGAVAQLTRTGN